MKRPLITYIAVPWLFFHLSPCRLLAQPTLDVDVTLLDQRAHGIWYDTSRARLWLTIPESDPFYGNSLGSVDPLSGTLDRSIYLGDVPRPLGLTENGQHMFVGLDAGSVVKVDLSSEQVVSTVELGTVLGGAVKAFRIDGRPGSDEAFGVIKTNRDGTPNFFTPDVFDGNSLLIGSGPIVLPTCNDGRFRPSDPDIFFCIQNSGQESRVRTLLIDEVGLQSWGLFSGLFYGQDGGGMSVDGDLLLTDSGALMDISAEVPVPLGTCSVPVSLTIMKRSFMDPYENLVGVAHRKSSTFDTLRVTRFNRGTFLVHDFIDVPLPVGTTFNVSEIICWGPGARYAFRMSDGHVLVVNGSPLSTQVTPIDRGSHPVLLSDGAWLYAEGQEHSLVTLHDVTGKLLRTSDSTGRLSLAGLSNGIHLVQVWSRTGELLVTYKWGGPVG